MNTKIEIYKSNNEIEVAITFKNENVWLSQKQISALFNKDTDTIGLHLKNIFSEEELLENATTELFSVVQIEGSRKVNRKIKFYNFSRL